MPHSYSSTRVHCTFATRGRRALIKPGIQERVWAFMGGIARKNA
jgi:hypothetical protein